MVEETPDGAVRVIRRRGRSPSLGVGVKGHISIPAHITQTHHVTSISRHITTVRVSHSPLSSEALPEGDGSFAADRGHPAVSQASSLRPYTHVGLQSIPQQQ